MPTDSAIRTEVTRMAPPVAAPVPQNLAHPAPKPQPAEQNTRQDWMERHARARDTQPRTPTLDAQLHSEEGITVSLLRRALPNRFAKIEDKPRTARTRPTRQNTSVYYGADDFDFAMS